MSLDRASHRAYDESNTMWSTDCKSFVSKAVHKDSTKMTVFMLLRLCSTYHIFCKLVYFENFQNYNVQLNIPIFENQIDGP